METNKGVFSSVSPYHWRLDKSPPVRRKIVMRFSLSPAVPVPTCKCANFEGGVRYPWSSEMWFSSALGGGPACSGCLNNCTAIVLSIAILLSGLRAASSAPTGDQEWWINPCSKQPAVRHSRSAEGLQLRRFLVAMRKISGEILHLYKSNGKQRFNNASCLKINKSLNAINTTTSLNAAMQAFYETLVQFAMFVDKLKKVSVKTEAEFDFARRRRIFEDVEVNLKLVICEYHESLGKLKKKNNGTVEAPKNKRAGHHDIHKRPSRIPRINMACLKKSMNQTQAHVTDIDFFSKLEKFLKQSRRILRMKKGPNKRNKKQGAKRTRRVRN